MLDVCYDTEFYERGYAYPVDFISIGMVRADGAEYYAINRDAPWDDIVRDDWMRENVLAHLPGDVIHDADAHVFLFLPDYENEAYKARDSIANDLRSFLLADGQPIRLWAWYADYDHVVLAQIFGRMIDMPSYVPYITFDVRQEAEPVAHLFRPQKPGPKEQHHALTDARYVVMNLKTVRALRGTSA